MTARKSVSFPAALHAEWAALAEKEGLSLAAYVTRAVEAARGGSFPLQPYQREIADRVQRGGEVQLSRPRPYARPRSLTIGPTTSPDKCLSRVQKGTFCKACGTTHR